VLPRQRLFERLDAAARVVWVSAPAGAGKTTLLSDHVASKKSPCLWYQADAGDADPATFFHYLGLAAKQIAPRYRKPLPALTPEYLPGLTTFARRFFEELYRRMGTPAFWVLDNYQEVPAESPLHEVLRVACESLPEGIRLIVLSRTEPPGALARLRTHGGLSVLGWEELRLTEEETLRLAELRRSNSHEPLPLARIKQLHAQSQGWAAGAVLLLEQGTLAKGGGVMALGDFSGELNASTQQLLFDYFAGELFDRAPAATQAVLLQTALPPQVTVPMAVRLTGDPNAARILQELHHQNYFIIRREEPEPLYEYHPLFRQFLLARAARTFTPAELAQHRRLAAQILEAAGHVDQAARLYRESEDWEGLARLTLSQAQTLLVQGRNQTLLQWLGALPADITDNQPWLLYWQGMACTPFNQAEARGYLERAYAGFEVQDDPAGLYLSWAGVMDTFNFEWHDYHPMDRWIGAFERLQARHPTFPSPEIELRVYGMLMSVNYRQPQHPRLPVWAAHAMYLLEFCTDASQGMQAVSHLLHYYVWKGDLFKATQVMEALKRLAGAPACPPLARAMSCALAAVYHWAKGEPQACLLQVAEGLNLARATGTHAWDSLLYAQGVYGNLVAGDLLAAETFLRDVASVTRKDAYLQGAHYHFMAALVAQHKGDFARGLEHAHQAQAMVIDAGSPFPQAQGHAVLALSLLELKKDAEAEEHLCSARALNLGMRCCFLEHLCLLIEARTALERGHEPRGLERLKQALLLGQENGGYALGWWGPDMMAKLYAKALEHDIEVQFVQACIRRTHLTPPDPANAPDNWPWPIKIHTLGPFAVVKEGKPLRFTGQSQKKPLELLQCLIALGGRQVPGGHVADLFWPDAEGDAAYRSLIITLHRLRQWLGYPEAVELSGGQLSLNPKCVWLDTWNFERLLTQAEAAGRNGSGASTPALVEKALALYRGPFLDPADHPWAIARREKLRAKFIHHLLAQGHALESQGRWDEVIACYLRGIEADEFVEALHQQLIRCYQLAGRTAEAQAASGRWQRVTAVLGGIPG
jgi:ATP/maltotriose-dependent transcriptional regulator MalT/DNA-binding SARP family transcriptional activator